LGLCKTVSVAFNNPCNRVQDDFDNRFGDVHQDYLLAMWQQGLQINHGLHQGFVTNSAHQEVPISFVPR